MHTTHPGELGGIIVKGRRDPCLCGRLHNNICIRSYMTFVGILLEYLFMHNTIVCIGTLLLLL